MTILDPITGNVVIIDTSSRPRREVVRLASIEGHWAAFGALNSKAA